MNDPLQLIKAYEKEVADIYKGKMTPLNELSLVIDSYDSDIIETPEIIESLSELKESLPEDYVVFLDRVMSDLKMLHEKTQNYNKKVSDNNNIIIQKLANAQEKFYVQLEKFPEVDLKSKVRISTQQMNEQEIVFLDVVYKNLGLKHIQRVNWCDFVFFEYEKRPNIHKEIIDEYNKVIKKNNHISQLNISNFTHVENVTGYFEDLLDVFKSKIQ